MPTVDKTDRAYKDEDLKILLVNLQETKEQVSTFIKANNYVSTVLLDSDGEVSSDYSVFTIPAAVLVDSKGAIAFQAVGNLDWSSKKMRAMVDRLIGE